MASRHHPPTPSPSLFPDFSPTVGSLERLISGIQYRRTSHRGFGPLVFSRIRDIYQIAYFHSSMSLSRPSTLPLRRCLPGFPPPPVIILVTRRLPLASSQFLGLSSSRPSRHLQLSLHIGLLSLILDLFPLSLPRLPELISQIPQGLVYSAHLASFGASRMPLRTIHEIGITQYLVNH